jgi:hypothetical protein
MPRGTGILPVGLHKTEMRPSAGDDGRADARATWGRVGAGRIAGGTPVLRGGARAR